MNELSTDIVKWVEEQQISHSWEGIFKIHNMYHF